MLDSEGRDVTGKIYEPLLPKDRIDKFDCNPCTQSFIISHKDTVLHNAGYSPFELAVDIAFKTTDVNSDEYILSFLNKNCISPIMKNH